MSGEDTSHGDNTQITNMMQEVMGKFGFEKVEEAIQNLLR
jgi:hypothetical protein